MVAIVMPIVMPIVTPTVGRLFAGRHLPHRPSGLSNGLPHCGQWCVGMVDSTETQGPGFGPATSRSKSGRRPGELTGQHPLFSKFSRGFRRAGAVLSPALIRVTVRR